MNRRRKLLWALLLVAVGAYFLYGYIYKDHRNIASEEATVSLSGEDLLRKFQNDNSENLLNQTVSVSGVITQIEGEAVTIDNSVYASFESLPSEIKKGDSFDIKGRCIGYDDLFDVVKMDQCILVK